MQPVLITAADWCDWAQTNYRSGRVESAIAAFKEALAIDSSCSPARFGLASLLLDIGNVASASTVAAPMAAFAPGRPEILWLQARIAQALGELAKVCDLLTQLLADLRLSEEQRAEALLMFGLALGEMGRSAEAFEAARQGKKMQRAQHAAEAEAREREVEKLRRLASWIAAAPANWRPLPIPDISGAPISHVFLLGFPRSGTTLLEQVLASHPLVETCEEAPTMATAYQAFLSDPDACAELLRVNTDEAEAWACHYWHTVREHGVAASGKVFIDKQPAGTVCLPIIARLFPRAKILFAIRDPRDVVLSCYRQAFQMNAMTYAFTDLAETAACYDACMTLADNARERLPLAWMDVHHEALVEDFDAELKQVLDFLELEPDPALSDFARLAATRRIRTPSATQVRAGINRRGLGRWKQFCGELEPVLATLAPWVERFGYIP